ncbi:NAD-dependent epimerase/dehydratase family protein [Corallococcus praedator]|uniref:NAD-dependent epimerase/dehydratase family protein n=1 Tax=Corallococcus praedator TaxID=2316724 RepID=A0ABX9QFC0_9BACT|nr:MULTISPECIES: NAD-dependent epimerase/dehydratase family protein [Corallococcus]RKH31879.1 NAD-dependent epimerase/dehydratase family protein [Corallococcus sp. CA031C]RKI02768.1 NAD-dependent epimerase/dehydratase family protein [Corallococcus praedator]
MRILVTGAAGFIGAHVCERLLARGDSVVGLDALDAAPGDMALRSARLARLSGTRGFTFLAGDITDAARLREAFALSRPEGVVHLAARVGVRAPDAEAPAYADTNVTGFVRVLEGCREAKVAHLVYASSSSVYGAATPVPFREDAPVDQPLNLYGATKRANELMAHAYSHLHRLPTSGLRFFTVYGPWGRPDMAPLLFLRALARGEPLVLHGDGRMRRDFTFVDDVAEAVLRVLDRPPQGSPPQRLLNVGHGEPVALGDFVALLERHWGTRARVTSVPAQAAEMVSTWADTSRLEQETGFRPSVSVDEGVARLVAWYRPWAEAAAGR